MEKKKRLRELDMDNALWSVRMRASKSLESRQSKARSQKSIHISGAEGLYESKEIHRIIRDYSLRAIGHPKGIPDEIVITIERVRERPITVPLLPVSTARCNSPDEARKIVSMMLSERGISRKAIQNGMRVVVGRPAMRGASLILSESGIRMEPERERGIRVSMLGIGKNTEKSLSRILAKEALNTTTVREALILASKVASCEGVVAELCISDDPDYTTGYVASIESGYVRIPHIKPEESQGGGRAFFIEEKADVARIIEYLEKKPVMAV